jgi:hypothetical protein
MLGFAIDLTLGFTLEVMATLMTASRGMSLLSGQFP